MTFFTVGCDISFTIPSWWNLRDFKKGFLKYVFDEINGLKSFFFFFFG